MAININSMASIFGDLPGRHPDLHQLHHRLGLPPPRRNQRCLAGDPRDAGGPGVGLRCAAGGPEIVAGEGGANGVSHQKL